jgi:glycosyltransferase involved in cell wall biosynthesis
VDEHAKADLYRRAWVHVTASASEGWSLTVMEAALCATPSAALAVGGLRESIVDGETGLLAQTPAELTANVRGLIGDPALRERLGAAARERALTFTWDRTAATTLSVVQRHAAARA